MSNIKAVIVGIAGVAVAFSAFSEVAGLPPKTNPRGNQVDCGAKTDAKLERSLDKVGPEIALGDDKSGDGKVTVGITGATASGGQR